MKNLILLLVASAAAFCQELAFTKGLPGWSVTTSFKGNVYEDTEEKLSDYCSVRLEGPTRLVHTLEVDADGEYEISFYMKGKDIPAKKDKSGRIDGARFVMHGNKKWQRFVANDKGVPETGTFDWKRGTGRFTAKNLNSTKIDIELTLLTPGTAWFDKISVRKLDHQDKSYFREALDNQVTAANFYPDGIAGFYEPGEPVTLHLELQGKGRAQYRVNLKPAGLPDTGEKGADSLAAPVDGEFDLPGDATIQLPGQPSGYYVAEAAIKVNGQDSYRVQSAFAVTPQFEKRDSFFQFGYGVFKDLYDVYKRVGCGAINLKLAVKDGENWDAEEQANHFYEYYRPLIEGDDYKLCFCMGASILRGSIPAEDYANGLPLLKEDKLRLRRELARRLATMTKGRVREWSVQCEIPSNATMDKFAGSWCEAMFNLMTISRVVSRAVKQVDPAIEFTCGGINSQERIATIDSIVFKDLIRDFDVYAIDAYTGNWNMLLGNYMIPEKSLASFYKDASDLAASLGKSPLIRNEETGYAISYGAAYDRGLAVEQACLTARTIIITRGGPVRSFELHTPARRMPPDTTDDTMCMSTIWKPLRVGNVNKDVPLPGGAMYATAAHQLSFTTTLQNIRIDNGHAYLFRKQDGSTLVAAWTTDEPISIRLALEEEALLTSMVGGETRLPKGEATLRLTQAPCYLTTREAPDSIAAKFTAALTAALPKLRVAATLENASQAKLFVANLTGKTQVAEIRPEGSAPQSVKLLPGIINTFVVPNANTIQVVCDGTSYLAQPRGSLIHVPRLKTKPVLDGSGAWLANLPRGELRYPDDIYPKEALHPERCYFKTSFNPNGHNFAVDYWLGYDDEHFYLAAKADDPRHLNDKHGDHLWAGDCLQWAMTTTDTIPNEILPKGSNNKSGITPFNYGLALTDSGTECFCFLGAAGPRNFPCKVTRNGNETFYEVAIPWSEIDFDPRSGKRFAFSFIVFDRNSEAERTAPYHIALTRGIAGGQDASLYKVVVFEE